MNTKTREQISRRKSEHLELPKPTRLCEPPIFRVDVQKQFESLSATERVTRILTEIREELDYEKKAERSVGALPKSPPENMRRLWEPLNARLRDGGGDTKSDYDEVVINDDGSFEVDEAGKPLVYTPERWPLSQTFWLPTILRAYHALRDRFGDRTVNLLAYHASAFSVEESLGKEPTEGVISPDRIRRIVKFLEADETDDSVGERQLLRFYCGCLSLQDEPLAGALALHRLSHIIENPRYSKYLTEKSKGQYILHAEQLLKSHAFPLPKEHEVSNESRLLLLSFLSMIHAHVIKDLFDEVTPVSPMSLTEQEQVIIKSIENALEGYQQICGLIEL